MTTAKAEQVLCFLKLPIVGTKKNRDTIYCSLWHIVNTHAKATSHIGHLTIAIDAAEQAETVDNKTIGSGNALACGLREPKSGTLEFSFNLTQMPLINDMGSKDEFQCRMTVEIRNDDILVGCPTATCHKQTLSGLETLHNRKRTGLSIDVNDTVETRISRNGHILEPYSLQ